MTVLGDERVEKEEGHEKQVVEKRAPEETCLHWLQTRNYIDYQMRRWVCN